MKGELRKELSRKCWFGCNEVEDEEHFLRECKIYEEFRLEIRDVLKIKEGTTNKLGALMGGGTKEEIRSMMTFIKKALARRKRLMELMGG